MIGKTISAIEHAQFSETVLLRFTDGTALQITGHSYEEVDLNLTEMTPEQVRRRAARRQGERETARVDRLTWATAPADTPDALIPNAWLEPLLESARAGTVARLTGHPQHPR